MHNKIIQTVSSYHVTYTFQNESTLYSCLNFKELLTRSRRETNTQPFGQTDLSGSGFKSSCSHSKSFSSHPFTIASVPFAPFCLCLFFFCCFLQFFFIYCFHYFYANYWHLLLSQLYFAITSSLYNTYCNRFYNIYVINICPRQLL